MALILASASPRRQELLRLVTNDFVVCPAAVDEILPPALSIRGAAQYLAQIKAETVAKQHSNNVVIGADTTVLFANQILGKPNTPERAAEMLRLLSGKTHEVITGVALAKGTRISTFQTETQVTFYPLTDAQIEAYVKTGEPLDKAGAYGIQGYGALLVRKIVGDYYGVVGLPVAPFAKALNHFIQDENEESL